MKSLIISMLNLNQTSIRSREKEHIPQMPIPGYHLFLFYARHWEPGMDDDQTCRKELTDINQSRIENIRKCREVFRDRFIGGLYDDRYARKIAPELVFQNK